MNCLEGGPPCDSGPGSKEMLDVMESLGCGDLYEVTPECKDLIKASEGRFNDAVASLIQSGGDADLLDSEGDTPLMRSALFGFTLAAK